MRGLVIRMATCLLVAIAWLMTLMPTPGNVALAGLTRVAAGPDAPSFAIFRATLKARWRLALRCTLVSVVLHTQAPVESRTTRCFFRLAPSIRWTPLTWRQLSLPLSRNSQAKSAL